MNPPTNVSVLKVQAKGKAATVLGYFLAIPFLLSAATSLIAGGVAMGFFPFLIGLYGISSIRRGARIKKLVQRFKQYVYFMSVYNTVKIDELAAKAGQTPEFVRKDLQEMINKKLFCNATISVSDNEIVIAGRAAPAPAQTAASSNEMVQFVCEACGARGIMTRGTQIICEYCDSLIT